MHLQQRQVLEGGGVEDHVRLVLGEDLVEPLLVADVGDDQVAVVEHAAPVQRQLHGVQPGLVAVQHDQLGRVEAGHLAAQLRADRAAGAGDQDPAAGQVSGDGLQIDADLPAAEQVLVADRALEVIDACAVDLADSSRTAEALARGTLRKFYGLNPIAWLRDERPEDPNLPVVEIREGGEALHLLDEPGDRIVVELGRAWFILTGLPPVTHLLLAPDTLLRADPDALRALGDALAVANTVLRDLRDDLRRELSTRHGVSLALLNRYYDDQLASLTGDGQKSVRALLAATTRSMGLPPVGALKLPPGVARA